MNDLNWLHQKYTMIYFNPSLSITTSFSYGKLIVIFICIETGRTKIYTIKFWPVIDRLKLSTTLKNHGLHKIFMTMSDSNSYKRRLDFVSLKRVMYFSAMSLPLFKFRLGHQKPFYCLVELDIISFDIYI